MSCICLCKDTNFKANHNPLNLLSLQRAVVYAYAKILILKQITTHRRTEGGAEEVVYAYAKILILKQITTCSPLCVLPHKVVYAYAKILILKQITTNGTFVEATGELYMPMQRY